MQRDLQLQNDVSHLINRLKQSLFIDFAHGVEKQSITIRLNKVILKLSCLNRFCLFIYFFAQFWRGVAIILIFNFNLLLLFYSVSV